MNKDVIYIDTEDDITAIVGKIKASKGKIVALVPPKRVGVLQSAVNMRLINRAAESNDKRAVLITNDQTLAGLASVANIPVAKNLQSKPELPEIPALKVDGDDDIIDGSELPVGDHASSADKDAGSKENDAVAAVVGDEKNKKPPKDKPAPKGGKKSSRVPNFNLFRKRFLLIGLGVLLLIGFLVWAIWFAPKATVVISAKANSVAVNETVSLQVDGETNAEVQAIKALRQEQKSEKSVEFNATGKKKVGERATGKVRIRASSVAVLRSGVTVPSGTEIQSSGGSIFVTTESAVFPKGDSDSYDNGVTVGVRSKEIGSEYNGANGRASTSAQGVTRVSFVGTTSGGSSKEVKVVSESDVANATEQLRGQRDDSLKSKLLDSFGSSATVIEDSYDEQMSNPSSSVAIDQEADGPVTLKATLTASMLAVDSSDIKEYLEAKAKEEIGDRDSQKIYDDGTKEAKFSQFSRGSSGDGARLESNVKVGPFVDEDEVKEQAKGKTYGDIQTNLEAIDGIDSVDVKFSPFWVRTVPDNVKRIDIKFDLEDVKS